jgi:hypothetical protein
MGSRPVSIESRTGTVLIEAATAARIVVEPR